MSFHLHNESVSSTKISWTQCQILEVLLFAGAAGAGALHQLGRGAAIGLEQLERGPCERAGHEGAHGDGAAESVRHPE